MIPLSVDGSPSGCRDAAAELAHLGAALEDTARVLEHSGRVAGEAWHGMAGDAFGRRTVELARSADEVAAAVRMLVVALRWLADRLDGVRGQLEEARTAMVAAGVPVPTGALPSLPDPAWTPDQMAAHQRALRLVSAARLEERAAQETWSRSLARVADLHVRRTRPPAAPRPEPSVLDRLGDAVRVREWPDLLPDGVDLPDPSDLPGLEDLRHADWPDVDWGDVVAPVLPVVLRGVDAVRRYGPDVVDAVRNAPAKPQGPAKLFYREALEQYYDDRGRGDLSTLERVGRSVLVGTGAAAGGTGALLLCTRAGLVGPAGTLCESGGAWLGEKGAERLAEAIDAR